MTNKMPKLETIDTAPLEKAMSELEQALEMLKRINYELDQGPPEVHPDEPTDYESMTHGY